MLSYIVGWAGFCKIPSSLSWRERLSLWQRTGRMTLLTSLTKRSLRRRIVLVSSSLLSSNLEERTSPWRRRIRKNTLSKGFFTHITSIQGLTSHLFFRTVIEYRIVRRVKEQFDAFMSGFSELIPQELINVFDERELEVSALFLRWCNTSCLTTSKSFSLVACLISTCKNPVQLSQLWCILIPLYSSDDWTKYTDYRGYEMNDDVIQWFWQIIRSWPTERKSRLLQFATGTSRIPVNGFKDLQGSDGPRRFTIEKAGDPSQLPKSHTCFNRVNLIVSAAWARTLKCIS